LQGSKYSEERYSLARRRESSRGFKRVSRESLNPHPVKLYVVVVGAGKRRGLPAWLLLFLFENIYTYFETVISGILSFFPIRRDQAWLNK
jgi:hypothetical protein